MKGVEERACGRRVRIIACRRLAILVDEGEVAAADASVPSGLHCARASVTT